MKSPITPEINFKLDTVYTVIKLTEAEKLKEGENYSRPNHFEGKETYSLRNSKNQILVTFFQIPGMRGNFHWDFISNWNVPSHFNAIISCLEKLGYHNSRENSDQISRTLGYTSLDKEFREFLNSHFTGMIYQYIGGFEYIHNFSKLKQIKPITSTNEEYLHFLVNNYSNPKKIVTQFINNEKTTTNSNPSRFLLRSLNHCSWNLFNAVLPHLSQSELDALDGSWAKLAVVSEANNFIKHVFKKIPPNKKTLTNIIQLATNYQNLELLDFISNKYPDTLSEISEAREVEVQKQKARVEDFVKLILPAIKVKNET